VRKNPWITLTVLALAQFMVVLDLTIVNVALPHIQRDLHFSTDGLQWIVNAYTLLFGGFLLLGGRAADLLGRRAMFMAGLALFTAASLTAGLADSPATIVAARAVQGLGGAMLSPAALSLLTVTFEHGRQRNLAMGIWGALAGFGGTLGVVLGGVMIDLAGWRSVFYVNVPIGVALIALSPVLVAESRERLSGATRESLLERFDLPGAVLGTGGVLALVFGIVRTQALGWSSAEVIAALATGVVLLAAFVMAELRTAAPLVPMRLFEPLGMRTSAVALALNGASFLGMFFLTAIFLQEVRHLSALSTGLELLPMGCAAILAAVVASTVVTRLGTQTVQIAGAAFSVAGLLLLSHVSANGAYASQLLPGFVLFGFGIIAIGVSSQIAAVAEVKANDAGAASAIITSAYQVGGALGLAIISTIAASRVTRLLAGGMPAHQALTEGFQRGLIATAAVAVLNLLVAFVSPRIRPSAELVAAATSAS
jgi:EmrB/QacA subfamily drug resistance transporter